MSSLLKAPSSLLSVALLTLLALPATWTLAGTDAHAQSRCPSGLCGPEAGAGSRSNSRSVSYVRRSLGAAENSLHILGGPAFRPAFSNLILPEPGFSYSQVGPLGIESTALGLGAAYGITNDLEVGAIFVPLQLSPEVEIRDAYGWVTLQSRSDVTDVGLRLGVFAPLADDSKAGLELAAPLQLHMGGSASLDIALISLISFGDETIANFEIPLRLAFNATENVFFGVRSGILLPEFESTALLLQLGAFVGYTVEFQDRPATDITVSATWPSFVTAADDYAQVAGDVFVIGVGANGFLFFE